MSIYEQISQVLIPIFGIWGSLLLMRKNKWWLGCSFINWPCWAYIFYIHHQWGSMAVHCVYLVTWIVAIPQWFRTQEIVKAHVPITQRNRRLFERARKELQDSNSIRLVIDSMAPTELAELIIALEREYQQMGGQELRCSIITNGLVIRPRDLATQ